MNIIEKKFHEALKKDQQERLIGIIGNYGKKGLSVMIGRIELPPEQGQIGIPTVFFSLSVFLGKLKVQEFKREKPIDVVDTMAGFLNDFIFID